MMKFSALNESSLSDDNGDPEFATKEAKEEQAYCLYQSALRKQSNGLVEEAEIMLKDILKIEFLTQALPNDNDEEDRDEEVPLGSALTLKYLLYKNLANISTNKNDYKAAVEYFIEALEIDGTDVLMWYRMGLASINISNFSLARLAFEEGLKCNPNHWPCLDNVITVMYALNDYANCLFYIAMALERERYYLRGLAFKDEIYREDPSLKSFCEGYFKNCNPSIHFAEYDKEEANQLLEESLNLRARKQSFNKPTIFPLLCLTRPINEYTWRSLGESLVAMYESVANANPPLSYSCKIDLSPCLDGCSKVVDGSTTSPSPVSSLSEACSSNSVPPFVIGTQIKQGLQVASLQSSALDKAQTEIEVEEAPVILNLGASQYSLPQGDTTPSDLSLCADSTSSNRKVSKRKRLLNELSEFSTKRRSSRVRNPAIKKPQDNINFQELLQKFLPPKLLGDGRCEDMDIDSEPTSMDRTSGDVSCGQSSENDKTGLNSGDLIATEKKDVANFIAACQNNAGVIDLLYKFVVALGEKTGCVWPKITIDAFCEAFCRVRKHLTVPNLFSSNSDRKRMKEIGFAILAYCEFKVDKWYLSTGHSMSFSPKTSTGISTFHNGNNTIGNDFHADMEFLLMLTVKKEVFEQDWLDYSTRALWLKAKLHSLEGEIDLAVNCMEKLSGVLSDDTGLKIVIQNCGFSNVITSDKVQQQLESLQRCQSLEEVQRLYEHGDYAAVVNLLILTFNQPRTKRKQSLEGVPERHAQLLLLQSSLWKLERYRECVYWSEVSFNEALQQFMNAAKSDWSETMSHLLSGLDNCAKLDSKYLRELEDSKLVRLTSNLVLVIVIQMENYDFSSDNASLLIVLPWIILSRLILNEDKREPKTASKVNLETAIDGNKTSFLNDFDLSSAMPSYLMLLFTAHEYLGRRSWCTTSNGLLLLHCIDIMLTELQDTTGKSYLYREDLETGLEQCIYCLYGHPNKRTRAKHLQEHNAKQITLTWERAVVVYQYFKPNVLPEFDSYRTSTVSAELESLLKRISGLVPPEEDPAARIDSYTAYIEGATEKCPEPPFKGKTVSSVVKDLYYLLGDYYFKNKEFSKSTRLYLMDICINPERQDSWAGMALSRSSQLDQKLNSYELRNESTIYRKSSAALKCFEHSLELDPTTTSLWIEHGSLAYILHSHASRQLKQVKEGFTNTAMAERVRENNFDDLYDMLNDKRLEMLEVAEKCFRSANHCDDGGEPEEAWLHHYMLGKIAEKKGEPPSCYLEHLQKALMYLHEDFARYPLKIQYHNPLELSIEALEVYYRVHASCLKFLWKYEDTGTDMESLTIIKKCLDAVAKSPFANFQEKCKQDVSCSSSAHSDAEEIVTKSPETPTNVDHNYYDDAVKIPQVDALNHAIRSYRPSIDSSPESTENNEIKEIVNNLVSAVAGNIYFLDEALEKMKYEDVSIDDRKDVKVLVETVEESVYTSKGSTVLETSFEKKKPSSKERMMSSQNMSLLEHKDSIITDSIIEGNDEFRKMQERAMELETEVAASLLVEEMRLESDARREMDDYNSYETRSEELSDVFYVDESVVYEPELVITDLEIDVVQVLLGIVREIERQEVLKIIEMEKLTESFETVELNDQDEDEIYDTMEIPALEEPVEEEFQGIQGFSHNDNPTSSCTNTEIVDSNNALEGIANKFSETAVKGDIPKITFSVDGNSAEKTSLELESNEKKCKMHDEDKNNIPKTDENTTETVTHSSPVEIEDISNNNDAKTIQPVCALKETEEKITETSPKLMGVLPPPTREELLLSQTEIANLIPRCLDAMRECLQRFIQHYKSLYRMAHYYCKSTKNKNLQWAREILLAATPATKNYASMPGLFADRKNTNLFNGIWRAPSNEIDRPGSFGAHMCRSVVLLIDVLTQQRDYNMLVYLTQQLHKNPELGKKYMRDADRNYLVKCAYESCVTILRDQLECLLQEEPPPEESRLVCCLLETYRACQTLLKSGIFVNKTNQLLVEAYTLFRMGEVDPQPSVLEQAIKFCQLQLGKSYPQFFHESHKSCLKYLPTSDIGEGNVCTTMPSACPYPPDAWQKEFTKSLMMPAIPGKAKVKSEIETMQDPLILIPIDAKFGQHLVQGSGSSQRLSVSPQMVHVEKPKVENLQACSVAFLPVTAMFPKESVNITNTVSATSLLSCQAFECFDVLTSIMQASGYKVAPQTSQSATDNNLPVNLVKTKTDIHNFACASNAPITKGNVGRPRKRKRKTSSQKIEALNLCKRISTKPIVSATIANSIAEIKVGVITSTPKSSPAELTMPTSSSFTMTHPSVISSTDSKILIKMPPTSGSSKNSLPWLKSKQTNETSHVMRKKLKSIAVCTSPIRDDEKLERMLGVNADDNAVSSTMPQSAVTAVEISVNANAVPRCSSDSTLKNSDVFFNKENCTLNDVALNLKSDCEKSTKLSSEKIARVSEDDLVQSHEVFIELERTVSPEVSETIAAILHQLEKIDTSTSYSQNSSIKFSVEGKNGRNSQNSASPVECPCDRQHDSRIPSLILKFSSNEQVNRALEQFSPTMKCQLDEQNNGQSNESSPTIVSPLDGQSSFSINMCSPQSSPTIESPIDNEDLDKLSEIDENVDTSNTKNAQIDSEVFFVEANEDSESTNIESSVIEQCAKEMLEFINRRVEDMILETSNTDFSNINVDDTDCQLERLANKVDAQEKELDVGEENSDTLDADIKVDYFTLMEIELKDEIKISFEEKFEQSETNNDAKTSLLERTEESRDSKT